MSYVYCTYLSFGDVLAAIGAATHNVCKGRLLLVPVSRVCAFLSAMSAVTVSPAVLWSGQGGRSFMSAAPAGAASVIASMFGGVSELKVLDLGKESLYL